MDVVVKQSQLEGMSNPGTSIDGGVAELVDGQQQLGARGKAGRGEFTAQADSGKI